MKSKSLIWFIVAMSLFTFLLPASTVAGQQVVQILSEADSTRMEWTPSVAYETAVLTVTGPNGFHLEETFAAGERPFFETVNPDGTARPSGSYTFEIKLTPSIPAQAQSSIATESDALAREAIVAEMIADGILPSPSQLLMSGYLTIQDGQFLNFDVEEPAQYLDLETTSGELIAPNDQQILDDLIVQGSGCIGQDCSNGESFGFDTIRLKENNLRIRAFDTSNSASFPSNDWQITFNDTSNGGANKFSIDDIDGGRTPLTIEAGAPSHSFYVDDGGRIGLGTSTPVVELHVVDGDSPTLRLQQDGSSGFTAQTWDVAGNEANFFVRDVTNGSQLPFKIIPGADHDSLVVAANNNIGIGTKSPATTLHLYRSNQTPTLRFQEVGNSPYTWDIAGNASSFFVQDITNSSALPFQIFAGADTNSLTVASDNSVGFGIGSPSAPLHIVRSDSTAGIRVQDTSSAFTIRELLTLENNGGPLISFIDNSVSNEWMVGLSTNNMQTTNRFVVSLQNTGGAEFEIKSNGEVQMGPGSSDVFTLSPSGNLTISGVLSDASSRALKENFVAVDGNILDSIMSLPIYFYNYKHDDDAVVHVGPTAEAFAETFNVGADNKHISPRDLASVAVAGVQELQRNAQAHDQELKLLQDELAAQEEQIELLEAQNAQLEARLAALEELLLSQDDETAVQE